MKNFPAIVLLLFTTYTFVAGQSFEKYQGNIINRIDESKLKQGLWIKFDTRDKAINLEEGNYKDNKKEGIWTEYFASGNPKSKITYFNNRADGTVWFYYPNGKISEEGYWKNNKWIGQYKYYYKNGTIKYSFAFNEGGVRTGTQKYYWENGKIMYSGEWLNGSKNGIFKEFDLTGVLIAEMNFTNGILDKNSVKIYDSHYTLNIKADSLTNEIITDSLETSKRDSINVKEVVDSILIPNVKNYKEYLAELPKKYKVGVTKEPPVVDKRKNIISRVIVNKSGVVNEFLKVETSWGQTYYFKNGQSISVSVFEIEIKEQGQ